MMNKKLTPRLVQSRIMNQPVEQPKKVNFKLAKRDHGFTRKREIIDFGGTRHGSDLGVTKDSTWGTSWDSFDSVAQVQKAQAEANAEAGIEADDALEISEKIDI